MNIEQTTDVDFITECVLSSYDTTSDDGAPPKEFYFPPMSQIWVRAEDYGVFMLEKKNCIMAEVHTVLLPCARGKSVEIGKAALAWAWENTNTMRFITSVPEFNLLALRLALKTGFKQYGLNPRSFSKNGVVYSQTLLGISRGE